MAQRYIQGIQLDVCANDEGIWLDKGEQRYLMAWYGKFQGNVGPIGKGIVATTNAGTIIEVLGSLLLGITSF